MRTQIVEVKFGVFYDVVQQAGGERVGVHVQFSQDGGDGDGVGDVGFAALAGLLAVGVAGDGIGVEQQFSVCCDVGVRKALQQRIQRLQFVGAGCDADEVGFVGQQDGGASAQGCQERDKRLFLGWIAAERNVIARVCGRVEGAAVGGGAGG